MGCLGGAGLSWGVTQAAALSDGSAGRSARAQAWLRCWASLHRVFHSRLLYSLVVTGFRKNGQKVRGSWLRSSNIISSTFYWSKQLAKLDLVWGERVNKLYFLVEGTRKKNPTGIKGINQGCGSPGWLAEKPLASLDLNEPREGGVWVLEGSAVSTEGRRPPCRSWTWERAGLPDPAAHHGCIPLALPTLWSLLRTGQWPSVNESQRSRESGDVICGGWLSFQDTEQDGARIWWGKWKVSSTILLTSLVETQGSIFLLVQIPFQCWLPCSIPNGPYLKVSGDRMLTTFHSSSLVFELLWLLESSLYSDKNLPSWSFHLLVSFCVLRMTKNTFTLLFWPQILENSYSTRPESSFSVWNINIKVNSTFVHKTISYFSSNLACSSKHMLHASLTVTPNQLSIQVWYDQVKWNIYLPSFRSSPST